MKEEELEMISLLKRIQKQMYISSKTVYFSFLTFALILCTSSMVYASSGKAATRIKMPKKMTVVSGIQTKIKVKKVKSGEKLTGLKWSSSNSEIATVSKKGVVMGRKAGTATITCKLKNGKKYKCKVKVKRNVVYLGDPETYEFDFVSKGNDKHTLMEGYRYEFIGNTLVMDCVLENRRKVPLEELCYINYTFIELNWKTVFKGRKNINKEMDVAPGKRATIQLRFHVPSKKITNLRNFEENGLCYTLYADYNYDET